MTKRPPVKAKGSTAGKEKAMPDQAPKPAEPKPATAHPTAYDSSRLESLFRERDELEERLAYMQAEFDNYKKRSLKDVEARLFRAKEALFLEVLSVMDNLDRALAQFNGKACSKDPELENLAKGVRLIHQQLQQVLASQGLRPIEALGQKFDPFRHEAVVKVELPDQPDNTVLEEVLKGYTLDGTVIRPSKVKVNVLPKAKPSQGQAEKK